MTLKIAARIYLRSGGQHFPDEGFKPSPPTRVARERRRDHNVGSQEARMFVGKLSLLPDGAIYLSLCIPSIYEDRRLSFRACGLRSKKISLAVRESYIFTENQIFDITE
jgi:hypothetical protein